MGNLSACPLPPPYSFATSLSIGDVEEVARRFRVSPPQTEKDKGTKFGVNCTANYLKTILTGVVEGVFMASQGGTASPPASIASDDGQHPTSGVDVEALFDGFMSGKLISASDGWMSFEQPKENDNQSAPPQGSLPKVNTTTINILPVLGALVVFAMPSLSNLDNHELRLNLLFDLFYFAGNDGTMGKDDILLMAISIFRGISVFMRNSEFNMFEKDGEEREEGRNLFNVDSVERFIVSECLGGEEGKAVEKAELVSILKKLIASGLEGVDVERSEDVFGVFSLSELVGAED
ncbi:hypothetical protein TrVE_jg9711 [Triparma verrucosa]|uniref:Uncharacterized protein n=1 Tax=Triparma verrucosa TaxID=1606542 RepID=A0A9W7F6C2_9STRA|nr:hypothetical protein TrVE_jg9711 [Triparma verrucosa]